MLIAGTLLLIGFPRGAPAQEAQTQETAWHRVGTHGRVAQANSLKERMRAIMTNPDSLRRAIEWYSKNSKRDSESINGLRKLLDVLDSETDQEFRDRVRRLPVTIESSPGRDASGRDGVWKVYTHRSGRQVKRFVVSPQPNGLPLQIGQHNTPSDEESDSSQSTLSRRGVPRNLLGSPTKDFCQYTDPWGAYSEGDCADEVDEEDSTIYGLATDSEEYAAEEEGLEYLYDFCASLPWPMSPQEQQICAAEPLSGISQSHSPGFAVRPDFLTYQPWAILNAEFPGVADCGDSSSPPPFISDGNGAREPMKCIGEAVTMLAGFGGYVVGAINFFGGQSRQSSQSRLQKLQLPLLSAG